MKRTSAWMSVGLGCLLISLCGLRQPLTELTAAPYSETTARKLIEQDTRNILDVVDKWEKGKKGGLNESKAIHANAMMIALVAQNQIDGKNADADIAWATLRDAAIKIALLGEEKKFAVIAEPTKALAKLKANPKTKVAMKTADLVKAGNLDVEILMQQLKSTTKSGYGVEEKIQDLADADSKARIAADEANAIAARLVTVADYFEALEPRKGFTKKNPQEDWLRFIANMRTAAAEMASATKGNDMKKIKAAFQNLDASCIACHAKFK